MKQKIVHQLHRITAHPSLQIKKKMRQDFISVQTSSTKFNIGPSFCKKPLHSHF